MGQGGNQGKEVVGGGEMEENMEKEICEQQKYIMMM